MAKLALNNYTITGEFGEVYKAHLTGFSKQGKSRLVAVKTLRGMVNISQIIHSVIFWLAYIPQQVYSMPMMCSRYCKRW